VVRVSVDAEEGVRWRVIRVVVEDDARRESALEEAHYEALGAPCGGYEDLAAGKGWGKGRTRADGLQLY
jgi:hypothetical protein